MRFTDYVSRNVIHRLRFPDCVSQIAFPRLRFPECVSQNRVSQNAGVSPNDQRFSCLCFVYRAGRRLTILISMIFSGLFCVVFSVASDGFIVAGKVGKIYEKTIRVWLVRAYLSL